MLRETKCPKCCRNLVGAIQKTTTNDGRFSFVVQQETSDCNWVNCPGCGQVMCKVCYNDQLKYCCNEGRIIDRERARAALTKSISENNRR